MNSKTTPSQVSLGHGKSEVQRTVNCKDSHCKTKLNLNMPEPSPEVISSA